MLVDGQRWKGRLQRTNVLYGGPCLGASRVRPVPDNPPMSSSKPDTSETTVVLNPTSGSGDHADAVRDRASTVGYAVEETERGGHAIELTTEAIAEGGTMVVAAGGDGTVNEVVRGVLAADALDTVTVGVIPTGTGNDFAANIGLADIDEAFTALQEGERRRLDLGIANGLPFVNSCIAGLTAEASARTSSELKSRFGVFAYVMTTLQVLSGFQGLELSAEVQRGTASERVWTGPAAMVLAGNGRRFSVTGGDQANMEDGFLDVTIIEDMAALDVVGEQARERLFGETNEHIARLLVSSMELTVEADEPVVFSLDGEMAEFTSISLSTNPRAVRMPVGERYEPNPDEVER